MSIAATQQRSGWMTLQASSTFFGAILFTTFSVIAAAAAWSQEVVHPPEAPITSDAQYCGIYSLYTLMELAGKDIEFSRLVRPEYVDSRVGSRLGQLKKAAEDFGLHATAVEKLNVQTLRQSPYPIIIHVKKTAESSSFNHFELYLGEKNGQAVLYDPPEDTRLEAFSVLASRWDRTGLAVSKNEIDTGILFFPARRQILLVGLMITVGVAFLWWIFQRRLTGPPVAFLLSMRNQ